MSPQKEPIIKGMTLASNDHGRIRQRNTTNRAIGIEMSPVPKKNNARKPLWKSNSQEL
jgi:hypothetical protein